MKIVFIATPTLSIFSSESGNTIANSRNLAFSLLIIFHRSIDVIHTGLCQKITPPCTGNLKYQNMSLNLKSIFCSKYRLLSVPPNHIFIISTASDCHAHAQRPYLSPLPPTSWRHLQPTASSPHHRLRPHQQNEPQLTSCHLVLLGSLSIKILRRRHSIPRVEAHLSYGRSR